MTQTSPSHTPVKVPDTERGRWRLDRIHPAAVLGLLPRMDRVMIALRGDGFMHERLGRVADVTCKNRIVAITGDTQDACLPENGPAETVLDISTEMRGKLYPHLEFRDSLGARILSVTGLEGPGPLVAALDGVERVPLPPGPVQTGGTSTPDVAEDDAGLLLLTRLRDARTPVQIRARCGLVQQRWDGVIDKVIPMGGHINVMTPDFHLHLAAGAVARWHEADGLHRAIGTDGIIMGLEVAAQ